MYIYHLKNFDFIKKKNLELLKLHYVYTLLHRRYLII